ncbi:hypothetical protein Clacol_004555 [Clathrus columnatus]|uniref:Uncharacterized protein n=1 Tax=Clathrus columnatus TaxID=1419009 RepID=A0AAV5AC82_9AGAM|nr:hypothetical protein Clacol_004555 [Clathrus columnatus]
MPYTNDSNMILHQSAVQNHAMELKMSTAFVALSESFVLAPEFELRAQQRSDWNCSSEESFSSNLTSKMDNETMNTSIQLMAEEMAQLFSERTIQAKTYIYIAATVLILDVASDFVSVTSKPPSHPFLLRLTFTVSPSKLKRNDNAANQSISAIGILPVIGVQVATIPACNPQPCKKKLKIVSTRSECSILIAYVPTLLLVSNATVILSDILGFLGLIRQVWGVRKLKRILSLHTREDVFALLLQQANSNTDRFLRWSE